ncbi:uncharacterized protein BO80DRAFT_265574 [Aspergillus ibericus CBS 121593]|uniref:Uncharacterized protein n=1 Tax=Aspergillus ibericus CBS 121593 TaxID=1448316 RepID=A0A395GIQ3_9EURO|nr:hypothetical protein BO80DRAFT_265574 [Aspergillus ibericus CBS 121593]RAK95335.1 hypothetical protein BO80DRAFT_265574 [Aspergillus ibericus CBS 121593]
MSCCARFSQIRVAWCSWDARGMLMPESWEEQSGPVRYLTVGFGSKLEDSLNLMSGSSQSQERARPTAAQWVVRVNAFVVAREGLGGSCYPETPMVPDPARVQPWIIRSWFPSSHDTSMMSAIPREVQWLVFYELPVMANCLSPSAKGAGSGLRWYFCYLPLTSIHFAGACPKPVSRTVLSKDPPSLPDRNEMYHIYLSVKPDVNGTLQLS